jgi:uncharacterized protein (TIGR01777 family)
MSGSSGFVGTFLRAIFEKRGWNHVPLGREDLQLEPDALAEKMKGSDIVINLAGAPVINRWTEAYKKEMYSSRINITHSLVRAMSRMDPRPQFFISTSAIGIYAPGGPHTEDNHIKADDFLGSMAQDWEGEALGAQELGIRTVIFRFGVVLGRDGGALKQMITPFKLGLGGKIGDGSQPFSWIHLRDLARAYEAAIEDASYEGTYNLTSPGATTNSGLTEAVGRALGRPTIIPVPSFVLKMQFGEGAQVLTTGQEVVPERLLAKGFSFHFNEIESAVKDCLS